jgi:hypothetical protein
MFCRLGSRRSQGQKKESEETGTNDYREIVATAPSSNLRKELE